MEIVAREGQIKRLCEFLKSNKPEFMAVYGRRRVGKTFLINQYFQSKECVFFTVTGIRKGTFKSQREVFCQRLSEIFFKGLPIEAPATWRKCFNLLQKALNDLKEISGNDNRKIVLFLDELPWLNTPRSGLLQALEYFWNQYWCNDPRVKLVVCGSLSSWIIKNVIDNTGGLYNRVTYRMEIQPFNLREVKQFLDYKKIGLNERHILSLYMAIGGVPLYLDQVKKGKSADQVIDELCFSKQGLLFDEIHELFKSLFDYSEIYVALTREIAKHRYGISKTVLRKKFEKLQGGRLNTHLEDLENTGYIASFLPYGNKQKGVYYKISDEYTYFYFSWIEPHLQLIKKLREANNFWTEMVKTPRYAAWKGYAFEAVCMQHLPEIMKALGISSICVPWTWRYVPKNKKESGAQIDLLFDRPDDVITLCEIKCTQAPYKLNKSEAEILKNRIHVFQEQTQTQKQIFLALISASGFEPTAYSEEMVAKSVELKDFF